MRPDEIPPAMALVAAMAVTLYKAEGRTLDELELEISVNGCACCADGKLQLIRDLWGRSPV